tara:strand:+ start:2265 stop:2978 length:714 start_codon:yes stop_codon:yes gene_type:complete
MILENKNCFITGATGGIGREIAFELASKKCNLFITSTNSNELLKLENLLKLKYGISVYSKCGDLNLINDIDKIIESAKVNFKSFDILINSAGIFEIKSLKESTLQDFEKTFNINVRAPFIFCKEFMVDMRKNKWGRIVNIGSSSSYSGFENSSLYCSSKHALLGFSRSLQSELKHDNIRSFCVSPGSVNTEMGKKAINQNSDTFIDPKELANLVSYIISYDDQMIIDEIRLNRMFIQ